ncbi:DNA-binding XRE family transcriptional regulator [Planomicrobium stackebrandtii]|uniref:DNA-binding XRE family transcriptional regulator n=1 Tax=Planomicrobium stackebrandtii TaxID=253160 RepID=A0ABU0GSZ9_9BACL|nr:helix-turn-helix transcriptional regulator [Planomicrobium stackebrandtii]MDQ0427720.1 DNA-binding XRE family transcriptional regulator [Planomicrobium stackebrandtii]
MKNTNLTEAREKKNLTQEQLAKMLGKAGKQSVSNWENGHSKPPLPIAFRIAEILEEDISFLFSFEVQDSHIKRLSKKKRVAV